MTKIVYFRSFEEEDAGLIYKWMNDDNLKKLSIGLNQRMSRNDALEWVKGKIYDNNNYQIYWAICTCDSNKMIGYAYLSNIHYINRSAHFGGIVIGDKDYQNGMAWIKTYLFVLEYVFERLNMNRICSESLVDHVATSTISKVMFFFEEGIKKQAVFKNGRYYDVSMKALLSSEYFNHKKNGDYEFSSILRRFKEISIETKKK